MVPNFPTYEVTLKSNFNNSAQERSQFAIDFLLAISVTDIDLILAHSAGMYAAVQVIDDERFSIRNLALINPGAGISILNARYSIILKRFIFRQLNELYKTFLGRRLIEPVYLWLHSYVTQRNPKVPKDLNVALLQACVVAYTDADHVNRCISNLKAKLEDGKLKLLMIFSERDGFISVNRLYELAKYLSDGDDTFEYYDEFGNVESDPNKLNHIGRQYIVVTRKGGHLFFVNDRDKVVEKAMQKFLMHRL